MSTTASPKGMAPCSDDDDDEKVEISTVRKVVFLGRGHRGQYGMLLTKGQPVTWVFVARDPSFGQKVQEGPQCDGALQPKHTCEDKKDDNEVDGDKYAIQKTYHN